MGPIPDWDMLKRQRQEDKFEVSMSYPFSIVAEEIAHQLGALLLLQRTQEQFPALT